MQATVKRKPVPGAAGTVEADTSRPPSHQNINPEAGYVDKASVATHPPQQVKTTPAQQDYTDDLENQLEHLQLEAGSEPLDALPSDEQPVATEQSTSSKFKTAFNEVKHFAGGLIAHPYEATKHFAVLRHSHGIVFYQGPYTSVAITIFSDQKVPPEREVWLQRRGFSGKTGMKVGALGTRSAWINVTPSLLAEASSLPPNDERAWQRDIQKFLKHAAGEKAIRKHRPRETHVLRIPHVAEDGYFRAVLCAGRRVLCPSPSFRLVSTSTDPGHVRGASLTSMPLEMGIKIGSMIARSTAQTATSGVVQPVQSAYQNAVQPYEPGGLSKMAMSTTYNAAVQPRVDQTVQNVNQDAYNRQQAGLAVVKGEDVNSDLLGAADGPDQPYPIEFTGKVVAGTGATKRSLGRPSANLDGINHDVEMRLSGVYAAWAKISGEKGQSPWMPAIVGVHPQTNAKASVVERRSVRVMILAQLGDFVGSKVSVMLVAFLHTSAFEANPDLEQRQIQLATDISIVEASLARKSWTVDAIMARAKQQRADRSMIDKAADARKYGQQQFDKLGVHRAGIRTESMGFRDQSIGNGGICVMR